MRSPQEVERALFAVRNSDNPRVYIARPEDVLKWVDGQPSQFERDLADFEDDRRRKAKLDRMTRKQVVQ